MTVRTIDPGTNWGGVYSRFSYDETNRYFAMLKESGVPVLDDEFNFLQDAVLTYIRRSVHDLGGGDGSPNNGFKIVGTSAANNFTIKGGAGNVAGAGVMYVAGLRIILPSDITYTSQENPGPALTPPGSGTRPDTVYLDIWLDEVSPTDDPGMVDPTLGTETSRRLRLQYQVLVAQGGVGLPANFYSDANGLQHYTTSLATIVRTTSASIDAGMVTDLRDTVGQASINSAIATHNADTGAHYAATTAQRGFVVLAQTSDVAAGTNTTKAVTPASLSGLDGFVPPGACAHFAGTAAPAGWLVRDGSAVSRSTYSDLFSAIGIHWGNGDGSTTFNLPDARRSVDVGSGGTGTSVLHNTVGSTGGEETHTLIVGEMPGHTHEIYAEGGWAFGSTGSGDQGSSGSDTDQGYGLSSSTGGDGPHNNIQPSGVYLPIIKY